MSGIGNAGDSRERERATAADVRTSALTCPGRALPVPKVGCTFTPTFYLSSTRRLHRAHLRFGLYLEHGPRRTAYTLGHQKQRNDAQEKS